MGAQMIRIAVLLGQGWFSSPGMISFADRLQQFGKVEVFDWWDTPRHLNWYSAASNGKTVVVGYSLGANQIGFLDRQLAKDDRINLAVAYDPSRQSPLVEKVGDEWVQRVRHIDRLVCYYNRSAWIFGGSKYAGDGVQNVTVNLPHLFLQFSEDLHKRTIAEIERLK